MVPFLITNQQELFYYQINLLNSGEILKKLKDDADIKREGWTENLQKYLPEAKEDNSFDAHELC